MKIFFIGSVSFSRKMLVELLDIALVNVVGIATKSASSFNSDHDDISDLAILNSIPFKFVKDINAPHIIDWIKSLSPDIIFCFGWSSLIKSNLLTIASKGIIGYHPAELPKNRGRHPIIWALSLGLKRTASTFFKMDNGADSGPIISQELVEINDMDDAQSLYNKLVVVSQQQVTRLTIQLATGTEKWMQQDDRMANHWRKRGKQDGLIDFRLHSTSIHNLVRALTSPYVGAHLIFEGSEEIKIWRTKLGETLPLNIEPGKVMNINSDNEIQVKTADTSIWLVDHEFNALPQIGSYL
ncbi:MAG: methionyl-tRNA formyltransferase [Sediminicola sp.]|jgi:methionyl-tRNA formyltransferase